MIAGTPQVILRSLATKNLVRLILARSISRHDLRHKLDESRMVPDGGCAHYRYSGRAGARRRFDIEVVQHLDMVTQETDRNHDFRLRVGHDRVANIGLEPRVARTPAAALERQRPVFATNGLRHQAGALARLPDVSLPTTHRDRNTMHGED